MEFPSRCGFCQSKKAAAPAFAGVTASVDTVSLTGPSRHNRYAMNSAIVTQLRTKLDFLGGDLRGHWQAVLDLELFDFTVS
jgi:hypothetical protein